MVCSYIILIDAALTCHILYCFGHWGGSVEYCWCAVGSANWIYKVAFLGFSLCKLKFPPSVYHHSDILRILYEIWMILQSTVLEDFAYRVFFGNACISNLSFSIWNIWKWMWSRCMEKFLFRASMLFRSADRFVVKLLFSLIFIWDGVLFMASPSFARVCFRGVIISHY